MQLFTDNFALRRPAGKDWLAYRAFMMSPRSQLYVGSHKSVGGAWRSFAATLGHWDIHGFGPWAVTQDKDDSIHALVGPWCPADWPEPEVMWMVLEPGFEGKGLAREAATAAIHHAYGTLHWPTVVHYITPDNKRSLTLAERLGARRDPQARTPQSQPKALVFRSPRPEVI